MADIVERLRDPNGMADSALSPFERGDAADEIERLRNDVEEVTSQRDILREIYAVISPHITAKGAEAYAEFSKARADRVADE